jgi:hypothetical protein
MKSMVVNAGLRVFGILVGWLIGATFGAGSGIIWGGGGGGIAGAGLFSLIGAVVGFFIIPDLKWLCQKIPIIGSWSIFK